MISAISNWSEQNNDELFWIYTHLKYPRSCYDNEQCHEQSNSKIRTVFRELSNSFTEEFEFEDGQQIQLDWCNLIGMNHFKEIFSNYFFSIENTTEIILVSLVSITTTGKSHTDCSMLIRHIIIRFPMNSFLLENIDPKVLLSKPIVQIIPQGKLKMIMSAYKFSSLFRPSTNEQYDR